MQPIQSSSSHTSNGCVDKVSSRCVTWDGPEITCLDGTKLCKGQTIDYAIYTLAKKLCDVLEAVDITNYANCLPPANSTIITIKQLFEYVIGHVCSLQADADAITNAGCPIPEANVPPCLSALIPGNPTTLPVNQYAATVAGIICTILSQITQINANIDNVNAQIADLWAALAACDQSNEPVQPTCTYDYTAEPSGDPVVIQVAYQWLESAFCDLLSVVGTTTEITAAVNKQCADLNNAPRLFGGGTMSNIPGWENTPSTIADSIGNMWLTVCDMRGALDQVLSTCCFSICNYMEFGYNAIWDVDGNYVDIVFIGATTLYQADATSNHLASYSGVAGGVWPDPGSPWLATDYPIAQMTDIVITLSDGSNQVILNTGQNLAYWLTVANGTNNGFHIDFTDPAFAGYDPQSPNQTITIQFAYQVEDGQTLPQSDCAGPSYCCEIDFTEGFPYQCNAPRPSECDLTYTFPSADKISITWQGLISETQQYFPIPPIPSATVDTVNPNPDELTLSTATWTVNEFGGIPGTNDNIVYIVNGTGAGQCRRIISNTATVLTVAENWDIDPDLTSEFIIANDYIELPYNTVGPPPVSYVNDYNIKICDATGFNPNDTSTWLVAYSTTYSTGLSVATSITVNTPPSVLVPNKNYVAVITANYNCGPSDPTFVYFLTPVGAIYQLEVIAPTDPLFTSVTGDVYNIVSNTVAAVPPGYSVSLSTQANFPLELPGTLGDSTFDLGMNVGALSSPNTICKCGFLGNPFQSNTAAPDYRGNILGPYRGYEARLEIFDVNSFTSSPLYDQSAPPIPYKTDSISDPGLTFATNTPLPPFADLPVGYGQPYFWIKGVYDTSNYTVVTAPDYHTITFDTTSELVIDNQTGVAKPITPGRFSFEVLRWDQATNQYISYSPQRIQIIDVYVDPLGPVISAPNNAPGGPYTVIAASSLYPIAPTLQCRFGDALIVNVISHPYCGSTITLPYSRPLTIAASPATPPATQYSCAGTPFVQNPAPGFAFLTSTYTMLITEDYTITWDFNVTATP